jgi:hypothetical protein
MIGSGLLAVGAAISFVIGALLLVTGFAMDGAGGGGGNLFRSGDEPVRAGFRGDAPVGLYFMTRFWSYTGTLEKAAWYFAPDGQVYRDLETGFSEEDLARHDGPKGTYRADGGKMTITWGDGKSTTNEVERDGDGFAWDMGIFTPVKAFDDESALVASWEGGESLTHGGNHASVAKTLEIRGDGTFNWSAVSFVKGTGDETEISGGGESGTSGRWELAGYSLILTDANGTSLRGIVFPYDDEKTPADPDWMFFSGTMYRKR